MGCDYNLKNKGLISIFMPCYKEDISFFCAAVNSVISQTYDDWELLLILDAPNNIELKEKAKSFAKADKRINIIENEQNMGLVDSLNNAIDYAKGNIIARLDADDIALPNRLAVQIDYMDDYDMISTNFSFINMDGQVIRTVKFPSNNEDVIRYSKEVADCMYHTTWMLRKEMYIDLNKYRDIGPFEDYDFILRGIKAGYRFYNIPDVLTLYRYNISGISSNNRIYQHLGSEYLRNNFERINEITSSEIQNYLKTDLGKKKIKEYEKFVYWKEKIFNSKNTFWFVVKLFVFGFFAALFNYYGRKKVKDWLKMKMMNKKVEIYE